MEPTRGTDRLWSGVAGQMWLVKLCGDLASNGRMVPGCQLMRAQVPPARRVREFVQALGVLAFGIALVLGLGWLTVTLFWAAIAESD
jgi:hypothetical protein